jgi:hypothetical protein
VVSISIMNVAGVKGKNGNQIEISHNAVKVLLTPNKTNLLFISSVKKGELQTCWLDVYLKTSDTASHISQSKCKRFDRAKHRAV